MEAESSKKPHSVTISRSSNSEKKLMAQSEKAREAEGQDGAKPVLQRVTRALSRLERGG